MVKYSSGIGKPLEYWPDGKLIKLFAVLSYGIRMKPQKSPLLDGTD